MEKAVNKIPKAYNANIYHANTRDFYKGKSPYIKKIEIELGKHSNINYLMTVHFYFFLIGLESPRRLRYIFSISMRLYLAEIN